MGKNEKTGLGRSLVKHHNQMIIQSKEKGRAYNKLNKKVLQSVTEVTDIDAILEHAEESERSFLSDHPAPLINLDANSSTSGMSPEEWRKQQKIEEALHAGSLRVPRRPSWNVKMTVEELDANEKQAFLTWRRSLARLEENERLVLTPFEKNLDIWRQLWRVLERSDLIVMVVDARDPLFYRCPDLEAYAREIDEHKKTMLLVNKADLLPLPVREQWANYFRENDILFTFWSAKAAYAVLEGKKLNIELEQSDDPSTKICGRDELLARLQAEAEEIARMRRGSSSRVTGSSLVHAAGKNVAVNQQSKHVVVGFVGYPNVGKSSTINALVGEKRTGVTSTPGKTKHFQTIIISEELMLCDCPGLVFPSFSSSRFEMIASGVLPIDRMTEHREAVQVVANRVPRHVIEGIYNITLPKPKPYEVQSRPPLAAELLRAYCASRGYVASSGLPDETKAGRIILKDFLDGKLPHFEIPPGVTNDEEGQEDEGEQNMDDEQEDEEEHETDDEQEYEDDTSSGEHVSEVSEGQRPPKGGTEPAPLLEHVLEDLNSFDVANGLALKKAVKVRKPTASHKNHKRPQRKKDRSWRVGSDDVDGMPVVRVFQKPVNTGTLTAR